MVAVVLIIFAVLLLLGMFFAPLVVAWVAGIIALVFVGLGCWFVANYKRGGDEKCDGQTYKRASIAVFVLSIAFVIYSGVSIYIFGTTNTEREYYSPSNTYSYNNNSYNYNKNSSYGFSDYLKDTDPDLYNAIKDRYNSLK